MSLLAFPFNVKAAGFASEKLGWILHMEIKKDLKD